jgi:phage-related minor tail protein
MAEVNEIEEVQGILTEFSRVEAGLAALREKHSNVVYEITTTAGMESAKASRAEIREPRFAVERVRKAAKAPLLAIGKRIDSEAARITDAIMAIEGPIDDQIKAEEARKLAEREAKKAAEVEKLRLEAAEKLRAEEERMAAERAAIKIEQDRLAADRAKAEQEASAERARVRAEQEKLAAQRAAIEAEAAAAKKKADAEVAAQRAAIEAEAAAARKKAADEAAAAAKVERERIEAERAKLRAEQEKFAAEERARAEAAKVAAAAEDERRRAAEKAKHQAFLDGLPEWDDFVCHIADHYKVTSETATQWIRYFASSPQAEAVVNS